LVGRELQELDGTWLEGEEVTLDSSGGNNNGGKPCDQFEANYKITGKMATYDESMYTTHLDSTKVDKQKMAAAQKIAAEIEGEVAEKGVGAMHQAEERGQEVDTKGLDEEELYSGVLVTGGKSGAVADRTNQPNSSAVAAAAPGEGGGAKRGSAFGSAFEKVTPPERARALAATLTGLSGERCLEFLAAMTPEDHKNVERLEDEKLSIKGDDDDGGGGAGGNNNTDGTAFGGSFAASGTPGANSGDELGTLFGATNTKAVGLAVGPASGSSGGAGDGGNMIPTLAVMLAVDEQSLTYLDAHGQWPDVTADELSKVVQLARLRFAGPQDADGLCQLGVLLKAEGQVRDALSTFELAADAASLVGLKVVIDHHFHHPTCTPPVIHIYLPRIPTSSNHNLTATTHATTTFLGHCHRRPSLPPSCLYTHAPPFLYNRPAR
jgi:hypothetical protein